MGIADSKSTPRKNALRTTGVSLEKFQEKVKSIGDATEELKESFRKVSLPATELEAYLLSLPEIPGDDRFDGQQGGKQKSLESLKRFKASLSDYQTASCKSIQDFLQFAKQQMEGICLTSKGSQSINSLDAFAFPETETDEGTDISCQSEKQLLENGEIKGPNLKKSMKLEDTLALFQTEEKLLNERDEIREKYFQERQLYDAKLEIWVASINVKKSDLEQQLQNEQRKVIMFEKTKEELENLKKEKMCLSDQLFHLKDDLNKQSLINDNEQKERLEMIEKHKKEIENFIKNLNDANEKFRSKKRFLEQQLQSERNKVIYLDIYKKEKETLKKDNSRMSDQLRQLQLDLDEQSFVKETEIKEWSKLLHEKEEEMKSIRKDVSDTLEQYEKENTNLKEELQSERKILDQLREENQTLKRDNDQLRQLQIDLTKQSSFHEEDKNKWLNSIKEKDDEIAKCRKDLNDANKQHTSEIIKNIRSIMENVDLTQKQNMELIQKESVNSDTLENFKIKHGILSQELSDLRTSLENAIQQHTETLDQIKTNNTNKVQHLEEKIRALQSEKDQHLKTIKEMKVESDRQKQEISSLKNTNDENNSKHEQLTDDMKALRMKNENLDKTIKNIESERENITKQLKLETKKALEKSESLTKMLEERESLVSIKDNELKKLRLEFKKLQSEAEQLSRDCKEKVEKMQNLLFNNDKQYKECKEKLDETEFFVQQFKEENEKLKCCLHSEYEKYESCRKDISKLASENEELHKAIKQADKDHDQKVKSLSDIIEKHQLDINKTNLTNRNLLTENKTLTTKLDQCKTALQKSESECQMANQKIKILEDEKKQLEFRTESLRKETVSLNERIQLQTKISEKQGNELISTKNQLSDQKDEISRLQNQNERNKDQIAKLQRTADGLKIENNKLGDNYKSLLNAHELINSELYRLKAKQILKIQLYSSCRGDMLSGVEAELMAMLRSSLENEKLGLEFSPCAKQSEIDPTIPTLLLCITASRLGTDVANAIQGLTLTNSMALVIFHHKDKHALPSQASDRVLTGSELSGIGGIYDFAFLAATGLHKNCQLNNNSFVSLVHFIRK